MNIEELSNLVNIKFIKNVLQHLKNNAVQNDTDISPDITSLETIIKNIKDSNNSITSSDTENRQLLNNSENKFNVDSSEKNIDINDYSDDYLYKKPWTKLSNIHKIIKLKEFVQKLIISNDEDRDKLKESLINLVNKKLLTKKDTVKYDSLNARIIGIPNLKFSNGKYNIMV
jgi:hypothetical protein